MAADKKIVIIDDGGEPAAIVAIRDWQYSAALETGIVHLSYKPTPSAMLPRIAKLRVVQVAPVVVARFECL